MSARARTRAFQILEEVEDQFGRQLFDRDLAGANAVPGFHKADELREAHGVTVDRVAASAAVAR